MVRGGLGNSQSLNRYSYVQGNPVSLTDPFGLSLFSWKSIGHGLLNALRMIPYVGEVFDLANAAWYLKDGDYAMAALSALSALTMLGNVASGALTMFKCAKAAKYVSTATKVISNAATFAQAASGSVKGLKDVCQNIKNGDIFTKKNALDVASLAINAFTMVCSGKNTAASGKELGGMLKKDVPSVWNKAKGGMKKFHANNGGFVNLGATIGGEIDSSKNIKTLYHYTNEKGMDGIVASQKLNPSLKANNPKDARYGNGQYLSNIKPNTCSPTQLAKKFINVPNKYKYTYYVEIDVTDLDIVQGRDGVFVIPNELPLDLVGRIVSTGQVGIK